MTKYNNKQKRIVVCDDDDGILEVISLALEERGYDVQVVKHCFNIERDVIALCPDLLLLDLWMPGVSGEEVAKRLKANNKTKHIPIVIVSANKDTEQIASSSGAEAFLLKPFDIESLEKTVSRFLSS